MNYKPRDDEHKEARNKRERGERRAKNPQGWWFNENGTKPKEAKKRYRKPFKLWDKWGKAKLKKALVAVNKKLKSFESRERRLEAELVSRDRRLEEAASRDRRLEEAGVQSDADFELKLQLF